MADKKKKGEEKKEESGLKDRMADFALTIIKKSEKKR